MLIYEPKHPNLEKVISGVTRAILDYKEEDTHCINGQLATVTLTSPLRYTNEIYRFVGDDAKAGSYARFDGIDFSGKAIFKFRGHKDRLLQVPAYGSVTEPFILTSDRI